MTELTLSVKFSKSQINSTSYKSCLVKNFTFLIFNLDDHVMIR